MVKLQSIHYAKLIQTAAYNYCNVVLGNTQINKILFYVYGVYLAETGNKLFEDDTPKAWLYGPVFPRVYKRVKIGEVPDFTDEEKKEFMDNDKAFNLLCAVCKTMPYISAVDLTLWSHEQGSPWYDTVYNENDGKVTSKNAMGTEISDEKIKEYFGNKEHRIYG